MTKVASGYERRDREHYPTPPWPVIRGLAPLVKIKGAVCWECACGDGAMVRALLDAGAKKVHATDVLPENYDKQGGLFDDKPLPKPGEFDFLSDTKRIPPRTAVIITNPPYGERGALAVKFAERGLWHVRNNRVALALLLSVDFDSARTRKHLFGDCPEFDAKIVLTERINWFQPEPGKGGSTENHAWYVWAPTHVRRHPVLLYAP